MKSWDKYKDYDYTKTHDVYGWAWEFLRRNTEYINDWTEYHHRLSTLINSFGDYRENWPDDDPNALITDPSGKCHNFFYYFSEKWDLREMVDPACDTPPSKRYRLSREMREKIEPIKKAFFYGIWSSEILPDSEPAPILKGMIFNVPSDDKESVFDEPIQGLTFDLSKNINAQIEAARRRLTTLQNRLAKKDIIETPCKWSKWLPKDWILYIRILDALDAGITGSNRGDNKTIFKIFKKEKVHINREKQIDDKRRKAIKLRECDYKKLLTPNISKSKSSPSERILSPKKPSE